MDGTACRWQQRPRGLTTSQNGGWDSLQMAAKASRFNDITKWWMGQPADGSKGLAV